MNMLRRVTSAGALTAPEAMSAGFIVIVLGSRRRTAIYAAELFLSQKSVNSGARLGLARLFRGDALHSSCLLKA
jgi:hypothetical protein